MMFSETAKYALRAVVTLAKNAPQHYTTKQVAQKSLIPEAYLSKVLQALRDAGIVQMRRGSGGGVALVGDAKKITILEVINAVDPLERITKCPLGLPGHEKLCPLHASLDEALARVEEALSSKTIADILPTGQISLAACQFPDGSAS